MVQRETQIFGAGASSREFLLRNQGDTHRGMSIGHMLGP